MHNKFVNAAKNGTVVERLEEWCSTILCNRLSTRTLIENCSQPMILALAENIIVLKIIHNDNTYGWSDL